MSKKIISILLALIYSFVYTMLGPIVKDQSFSINASMILPFIVCFSICLVINILLFTFIPKWKISIGNKHIFQSLDKLGDRKLFLIIWVLIFITWIPAYLILYPGVLSYDILSQVASATGEITSNHHPVLHTWLIRAFMNLGMTLFHSYEVGIGFLSILQMIILSYANTRLVMLLKKKGVPSIIVVITSLLTALWFMNVCLSVTMVKDTLHAAFLVLFACHFTEIVMNPFEYMKRKQNLVLFPLVVLLMCVLRNNGIYIYVFCILGLLIFRISRWKKVKEYLVLLIVMVLPIIAFKLYTGPFFDAMNIQQGEVREALCIPIQQLQRVAINKENELTDDQLGQMNQYIDNLEWRSYDNERQYDPFFADPAKSCFYSHCYTEDPITFWKFYLKTGTQFTREYVRAFLSNTLGYWYPGEYRFSIVMYENYSPDLFVVPLERKSIVKSVLLENYYKSVCTADFWRTTPIVRLFFVPGYSIWILAYALVLSWRRKGFFTEVLPLFLPLIAQYGIMILSPMSSFRYSWPFYLMVPLTLITIFTNKEESVTKSKNRVETMEDQTDVCKN